MIRDQLDSTFMPRRKSVRIFSGNEFIHTVCKDDPEFAGHELDGWRNRLEPAVQMLPAAQKSTIEAMLAGQKVNQIAKATGWSHNTVSWRHCRAIEKLRSMLA